MAYQPQFVPPTASGPPADPPANGGYGPPPTGYPQAYPNRPYPSQPYPNQAYPSQAYPSQAYPSQPHPPAGQPTTYVIQPAPRPQRPAVVGMSATMTVTASTLWVCALAMAWLFAAAGQRRLEADQDFDGQVLILLNRFSARLLDGLAIPLFGLPAIAFVAAFVLLSGRRWAQILYTGLGALSIGWLVWWLHYSPGWAVAPITYIAIAVGVLWTPAAVRWFGRARR